ncbi:MAG TPA: TdeIII family type II restriction endonuclease [Ignavibacteriaceae bacterium]|nr:TdeIII family type II restriction endonuclease [Ignavibacteriaceae bacterium]
MPLTQIQKDNVSIVLKNSLLNKFQNHNPEPASMPFHTRLLGKDRLALYQFIHSLNTNFGTTIFEPVALALASSRFAKAESQQKAGNQISSEVHRVIQNIMDGLSTASISPNKIEEIEAIRSVCNQGTMNNVNLTKVDIKLTASDGLIYYFDLKTAKPNAGGFKEFKRTLLEWVAATLAENPNANVQSFIAIPYNPYEPKPYTRWTIRGMLDLDNELKVAKEFWDFIGGEGAYEDLLDCFEQVGIEMRDEIDKYFSRFK